MVKRISIVIILILICFKINVDACTNFLITKGATTDGSTMITYSADSHVLYGELYYRPAKTYPEGTMLDIYEWDTGKYLGKIKQARKTYSVVGNMNEFQVAIGETTFGGRNELINPEGILDYGSLIYVTLQRAKTAREAIKIMGELVAEYGYNSSGESFSISDPQEVWIMEMIGKGPGNKGAVWVAVKIPDGYVSAHANQARIRQFPLNDPQNCIYSIDVINFARSKGYFKGKDEEFSFSDTYAPVDFSGARFCEARVWAMFNRVTSGMDKYLDYAKGYNLSNRMPLYVKPDKKLSVHDVMELMRDIYQGTELDMTKDVGAGPFGCGVRWRPLEWEVDGVTYFNERATSTQQTGFSFVAQSREWLPSPIGGILWFGVDDTYFTIYSPMYCGITKVPESYAEGNGSMMEFSETSAFWAFNQLSNFAYTRWNLITPETRKAQYEIEMSYINEIKNIDNKALALYKKSPSKAIKYLTEYSVKTGNNTVNFVKNLYRQIFVKYMDGNVKEKVENQKNPKVIQPGYGENWYRLIIKETGDKFKVPQH